MNQKPTYEQLEQELLDCKKILEAQDHRESSDSIESSACSENGLPEPDSTAKYFALFEAVDDAIFFYDPKTFEILEANAATSRIYGYSPEELKGMSCLKFSAEVEQSKLAAEKIQQEGYTSVRYRHHKRKDGTDLYIHLTGYKVEVAGKPLMFSVCKDLTKQKLLEDSLYDANLMWETTFNAIDDMVCLISPESEFLQVNETICRATNLARSELIGKKCHEIVHGTDRPIPGCPCLHAFHSKKPERREYLQDGRYFELSAWPIFDKNQKISSIVHIVKEITEKKEQELKLQLSYEHYRAVTDNTTDYIMRYDRNHVHIFANKAAIEATGLSEEEYIGRTHREMGFPEPLCQLWEENIDAVFASGESRTLDFDVELVDGTMYLELKLCPEFDKNGSVVSVLGISRDITERKLREIELADSERKFKGLFQNMTSGHALHEMIYDEQGRGVDYRFLEANQAFYDLTGLTNQIIGKKVSEIIPEIKNDPFNWISVYSEVADKGNPIEFEQYSEPLQKYYHVRSYRPAPGFFATTFDDVTQQRENEKLLLKERNRAEQYLDIAGVMLVALDSEGHITLINKKGCEILGWKQEEIIGKNWFDHCLPREISGEVKKVFHQLMDGESHLVENYENPVLHKSGKHRIIAFHNTVVRNDKGDITGILFSGEDITEQRQAEAALAESEGRTRTLFQTMSHGVVYQDQNGLIVDANPAAEQILGLTLEQMQGRTSYDPRWQALKDDGSYFLGDEHPAMVSLRTGRPTMNTVMKLYHPGLFEFRWIKIDAIPIYEPASNQVQMVYAVFTDITDLKNLQLRLADQSRLLDLVFEHTLDSIVLLDKDYNFIRVSEAYARACKRDVVDFPGHNHFDLYPSPLKEEFDAAKNGKSIYQREERPFIFPDHPEWGTTYWDIGLVPLFGRDQEIEMFLFTLRDVTSGKLAQQKIQYALVETEQRKNEVSHLLKCANTVLNQTSFEKTARIIFDSASEIINTKSGYVALLSEDGLENEVLFLEAGGMPCSVNPDLPMPIRGLLAEAYKLAKVVFDNEFEKSQWRHFLPQGHVKLKNVLFAPLVIRDKTVGIMGLANKEGDFTESDARLAAAFGELASVALRNVRDDELLLLHEEKLKEAQQIARLGSWEINLKTGNVIWSEEMYRIFNKEMYEPVTFNDWKALLHPADRERVLQSVDDSLHNRKPYDIEYRIVCKNGEQKHLQVNAKVFFDKNGEAERMLGTALDITEHVRHKEELSRAVIKAQEADKLKSSFLSNMSHEIRTPLNAIVGYTDMTLQDSLKPEHRQNLQQIQSSSQLLLKIISDILDFSKIEAGIIDIKQTPFSVKELFSKLESTARILLGNKSHDIELQLCIDSDVQDSILSDEYRIQQVLLNLLSNAVKFTEKGSIEFGVKKDPENRITFFVKDTGRGISEQAKHLLYQPFTQGDTGDTRRFGGTGLGLALSKRIVELMDGQLAYLSSTGEEHGSEFTFHVPYRPAVNLGTKEKKNEITKSESGKTILLVEDDKVTQTMVKRMLEKMGGYKVQTANNGSEGVAKFQENSDIDLILMDMQMPVKSGLEATREIRKIEHEFGFETGIPIIMLTAAAMVGDKEKGLSAGCDEYITKPLDQSYLLETLKKYLREQPSVGSFVS